MALTELPVAELRWSCPRSWVGRAIPTPAGLPPALWGLTEAADALASAARTHSAARPRHLLLVVPAWAEWGEAATAWLRACGAPATRLVRPDAAHLRGRGAPGTLAGADGGLVVVDARDLGDGGWAAVMEAARLGRIERTGESPRSDDARVGVVLLAPEASLKALGTADPRLATRFDRVVAPTDVARDRSGGAVLAGRLRRAMAAADRGEVVDSALAWLVSEAAVGARRGRLRADLDSAEAVLAEARAEQASGALTLRTVKAAWRAREQRASVPERNHRARIATGQLLLQTTGESLGVVNGLMIYGGGKRPYCIPGRITARAGIGRQGIINVEREAKYSGRSYDKGVLQLHSLLRGLFAQEGPLGVAAAVAFEQSYGNVDGDSATLAKATALFSELAELPARQGMALTGSVNHRGELQPVGSVNLKIGGWFQACRASGLTGGQGVLLPRANVGDLQLDEDVLAAVRAGRFHVWSADTLGEALELSLGRAWAGEDGVLARARTRMVRWSERLAPPRRPPPKPAAGKKALPKKTAPKKAAKKKAPAAKNAAAQEAAGETAAEAISETG